MNKWTRAMFQPNLPLYEGRYVTSCQEHITLSKQAATEGMVLLKNNNDVLPLKSGTTVALFGKGSFDYVKGGGGSGDVTCAYVRNLYDGLKAVNQVKIFEPLSDFYKDNVNKQYADGAVPGMTVEPDISDDLIKSAANATDTAIITISRFSGEGWDRSDVEFTGEYNPWDSETTMPKIAGKIFGKSDFYLTEAEKNMISKVKANFKQIVVVINAGGITDLSFIKDDDSIDSALHAWQGGMEGGLAMAELLCGIVNPSGKLPDTFAMTLEDYPSTEGFHDSFFYVDYSEDIYVGYRYFDTIPGKSERVVYPFGYGLSYTTFDIETISAREDGGNIELVIEVTNTGSVAGKEVVQVYYSAPYGLLGKPAKELAAFAKTKQLAPGESQAIVISFTKASMASFDDLGKIAKSAYVLEKGSYQFFVGNSSDLYETINFTYDLDEDVVVEQLTSLCAPTSLTKRLLADGTYEELPQSEPNDPNECIFEKMEPGTEEALVPAVRALPVYMMMNPYKNNAEPFWKVATGEVSMDQFIAQLSDDDLIHMLGGQPNTGVGNTFGYGNLPEYGVPNIMTADGPAGVRIGAHCSVNTTAWPCATLLASTWNTDIVTQVGVAGAEELKENNLAVWLTPAVNIHRSPMCGRNFEYYSEDPLLAGKMGAAAVNGIQSLKVGAAVKHF
ncbi:MAG: glycoside hydrolase family 3 C-terminal domain-containing protein, partial [Lachnospiraceae bacterium]|nr:glycoside hydrolase family 3 C-terminal domain-containing protein [Lachnospiraceae bacterium]